MTDKFLDWAVVAIPAVLGVVAWFIPITSNASRYRVVALASGLVLSGLVLLQQHHGRVTHDRETGELKDRFKALQSKTDAVSDQTKEILTELHRSAPATPAKSARETPPSSQPAGVNPAEQARRNKVLALLRNEYILSHDGISPGLMAGTEWPPPDWLNGRLGTLGETWKVKQGRNSMEIVFRDK